MTTPESQAPGRSRLPFVIGVVVVTGPTVTLQDMVDIGLADHDIPPPSRPGFVEVADHGAFEFLLGLEC